MLQPKRTKFRKVQTGRNRGFAQRGNKVSFGDFGLKATTRGRLTSRQIESARRTITRTVKRGGKLYIRVFPDKPISKKPLEVRMGKGKGNVEYWVCQIQPGRVLYEMEGVSEEIAREAFRLAAAKLAVLASACSTTSARRMFLASSDTPKPNSSNSTSGMMKAIAMLDGSRRICKLSLRIIARTRIRAADRVFTLTQPTPGAAHAVRSNQ